MTTERNGINRMGQTKKRQDIWGDVLTEKGYMRVPRALRLKRAELRISNNEYAILLDYLDYYSYSGGQNPYAHLAEVNGVSERTIQKRLGGLAEKGLIGRVVKKHLNGRTKGVVFSIEPLIRKLRGGVKGPSPTEGEKVFTYVGEETAAPNTREEGYKSKESKKCSGIESGGKAAEIGDESLGDSLRETRERYGDRGELRTAMPAGIKSGDRGERLSAMPAGIKSGDRGDPSTAHEVCAQGDRVAGIVPGNNIKDEIPDRVRDDKKEGNKSAQVSKAPYNSTKWYNEVFSGIYKEASGQPVLTGGREYGAARTYFSRLRELNPLLSSEEIYERATHGAAFMLESQTRGGVFGWMHCPPDICMLSSQAQAVDYHLRKTIINSDAINTGSKEQKPKLHAGIKLREKEANYASEEITRIYGELRGLGDGSREE